MLNKKIFRNVTIKNNPTFSLILATFATGTSFSITIKKLFIRINAQVSMISNAVSTMRISTRIVSSVLLRTGLTTTMNLKNVRMVMVLRENLAFAPIINITTRIVANASQVARSTTLIHIDKLRILASPLLGQFYTLGAYDSATIGSKDSTTLGDLDFVAT